jgi:hypothetical protein
MTICTRIFNYVDETKDSTVKQSGWRLENTPTFDPMNLGYGVIHDAVEHHEAGESGIENEMMAFGAIFHIRVQGKWWDQFGVGIDAGKMMAWDIARFLYEQEFNITPYGFASGVAGKPLSAFFVAAREHYIKRLYTFHEVTAGDAELLAYDNACQWLQAGYERSLNRWNGRKPVALTKFFNALSSLVDNLHSPKHMSTLKVIFDTKTLEHQVYVC